jgi:hypothetical protein
MRAFVALLLLLFASNVYAWIHRSSGSVGKPVQAYVSCDAGAQSSAFTPCSDMTLTVGNAGGTTYYIDHTGGADTNNGTSTTTPCKHALGDSQATSNANAVVPLTGTTCPEETLWRTPPRGVPAVPARRPSYSSGHWR